MGGHSRVGQGAGEAALLRHRADAAWRQVAIMRMDGPVRPEGWAVGRQGRLNHRVDST